MNPEIERKFLVSRLPDLSKITLISYERWFFYNDGKNEIRIQRKGGKYELERKSSEDVLESLKDKLKITKEEFEFIKQFCTKSIIRDSYLINKNPEISIKIYHGDHEGLIRAEVEFESKEEAMKFIQPDWFGKEITDSPLGKDSKLVELSKEELKKLI